jgi:dihydroflavonol-4-reductase
MLLVTGATGFLGHHLIPRLRTAGHDVRALVRPGSDTRFLTGWGVELAYARDIADRPAVCRAMAGCALAIHAAGHFRFWGPLRDFWGPNVDGTAAVLAAAEAVGLQRLVHISTMAVIGRPPAGSLIDEDTPCRPQDHYQRTKLEGERLALAYHRDRGVPVVVLRPGAFYGPWGHYAFNRLFFEEPLSGWRIRVNRGRHVTFPAYVPDVAETIVAVLSRGTPGQIYHLSGPSLTHNEANGMISDLAGISRWRFNVPIRLVLGLARAWTALSRFTGREPFYPSNMAPYVFADWRTDTRRAQEALGFRATPFATGALETLDWYRQQALLPRLRSSR